MRSVFLFLLLAHGLIHAMGFFKAFGLAQLPQLTQSIPRSLGIGWLLAILLFLLAAGLFYMGQETWWWAALSAVLLSQVVIGLDWQDARFGTVANLLVLLIAVFSIAQGQFKGMVRQELIALMPQNLPAEQPLTSDRLATLPEAVRTWLTHAGAVGKPLIGTVHLQQTGKMRTAPGGNWLPFRAEQYFTVAQPGFSWMAEVRMMPLITLLGRDKYAGGKGQMLIKLLGLIPVVNSQGPAIDQGTMLRYLAEIIWFPTAALSDYLRWEDLGPHSARATMTYRGVTASAVFHFHPSGDFQSLEAQRYYERKTGATLEKWLIQAEPDGFRSFAGIRIPARCSVTWQLKAGDFNWLDLEITQMEYNQVLLKKS